MSHVQVLKKVVALSPATLKVVTVANTLQELKANLAKKPKIKRPIAACKQMGGVVWIL